MIKKLLINITLPVLLIIAPPAVAYEGDLPTLFKSLDRQTKGPFGLNILQGTTERISVAQNRLPKGFLFQAAYRNDLARAMINEHEFYIGNLFTTAYYELMGEYVYGDVLSNHPLDHAALASKSEESIKKASLIVQQWVLEKYYVGHFPSEKLSRSFKIRGISGSEFEVEYARYFFNFYLGAINREHQYLPIFLLAAESPIANSPSLAKARELITVAYDEVSQVLGTTDPLVRGLYKIRNSIHNQLSPSVITEIDSFLATYPRYRSIPHPTIQDPPIQELSIIRTDLDEVRNILVQYYSFSAEKIVVQARKADLGELQAAAQQIVRQGPTAENLLTLSVLAAAQRELFTIDSGIPFERRSEILSFLTNLTRYLKRELSKIKNVKSKNIAETVLNTVYIEGFLIKDNWLYFKTEIDKNSDLVRTLTDVVTIASGGVLLQAFDHPLRQWLSIEPKMQQFFDNTLKSSAVDTTALIVKKMENL